MHIVSVELENIKSHRQARFDFERGTTAIMGENGAGKTTIIEAVAWTLFDLIDYKKEDFVTRGQKKGTAKVRFVSSLDEREYIVVRDTVASYYVLDPVLDTRIAKGKEEVTRTLWQHLGVEVGTDLEALFRRAIGVPQGTFTAIFLESPTERKKAFDALLKVEEYREGAQKLLETSRYVEKQIQNVSLRIANAEGQLARLEEVETSLATVTSEVDKLSAEVGALAEETESKRAAVKTLDELEARVTGLASAVQKALAEKSRAELLLEQATKALDSAKEATSAVERVRSNHEKHLKALGTLKELERERAERDKVLEQDRAVETAEVKLKSDRTKAEEDLARAHSAAREIEALTPKVEEQKALESELQKAREALAESKAKQQLVANLDKDIERLRDQYKKNQTDLKAAEAAAAGAADVETLRRRDADITRELTQLRTQVEYDERFQKEIKNGLCPILSAKCLNLKEGETLEGFLKSQFTELRSRISSLESEQKTVAASLKTAADAEKAVARLAALRERETEIADDGKRLKTEREELIAKVGDAAGMAEQVSKIEKRLKDLEDPRGRIKLLQTEAGREAEVRALLGEIERNFERLETDRKVCTEKLDEYKNLDERWKEASSDRDSTTEAHRTFLQNEPSAKSLEECESKVVDAKSTLEKSISQVTSAEAELAESSKGYDADVHRDGKASLLDAERRYASAKANFDAHAKQKEKLEEELKKLSEIKKEMQSEFHEKERLQKVYEATEFIRETLKEAAPRVARNYVHHVALEANQMFRDITGNAERTLKWTEDYGIVLEEDGHDRPFGNLSGGEQMSAALSVRLALLKQLSDIRIAFFDEPTTNMDAARRERLAEQISQITQKQTFDQLLVISHDDTFEHYVDNVLTVGSV